MKGWESWDWSFKLIIVLRVGQRMLIAGKWSYWYAIKNGEGESCVETGLAIAEILFYLIFLFYLILHEKDAGQEEQNYKKKRVSEEWNVVEN